LRERMWAHSAAFGRCGCDPPRYALLTPALGCLGCMQVTIYDQSHQVFNLVSTSMSFPNLPTKYIFHRVSANCTGLPDEPFTTYEERPLGRLVTKWVWRFESEMPSDICASTG
jgi:hypothetical protein